MTAFAIFCVNDGSLTFYKRDTVPAVGDTFEGKVVSNVYEGFETENYADSIRVPWRKNITGIVDVSFQDEIFPISTSYWFNNAKNMISFNGANLNTSNVADMTSMFDNCSALTSLDLSNFDTSQTVSMSFMFNCCTNLVTIYVSDLWSTAATTSNGYMFYNCKSLVGAISFDSTVTNATHANYQTGYLTYKRFVIPEDMLILNTTLYDLADKIRVLSAKNDSMNPIQMSEVLAGILDAKEVLF